MIVSKTNRIVIIILSFLLIFSLCSATTMITPNAHANNRDISLFIDHRQVQASVPPQMFSGRTVAPVRIIFERLGAKVTWDASSGTISAKRGTTTITMKRNQSTAMLNGKSVKLDVPAVSIRGSVMVPLRFVADALNAETQWDSAKRVVNVYSQKLPLVTIEMQDGKKISLELYPKITPNTVNNFISLVRKGFYDGIIFHRIIPGFMIQGGDPLGQGFGGPGYSIKGEFSANKIENPLLHTRGVLSMARSRSNDSAGSQFFIMVADTPYLDGSYAAFGKVRSGMHHVDAIVSLPADADTDRPFTPPVMKKVTVQTFGVAYPEPVKVAP